MAQKDALRCSVITPERKVLEESASAVVFPAHDGQLGVLRNRAPLVCELGAGILKVEAPAGGTQHIFINGGFAQVLSNEVTILTERATPVSELTAAEAEEALAKAQALPGGDDESADRRTRAIAAARAQRRAAVLK